MDTQVAPSSVPEASLAAPLRPPGIWRQGWYRFRRNRGGMLGLFLVALVVLVAVLSPFVAPFEPSDQSAMLRGASRRAPDWIHLLGTDRNG
ncbi:MAG: hypothetical protein JWR00_1910, partial [Rubritepida sp.]|nr:hypothetical protein [Rubritepida sp.]